MPENALAIQDYKRVIDDANSRYGYQTEEASKVMASYLARTQAGRHITSLGIGEFKAVQKTSVQSSNHKYWEPEFVVASGADMDTLRQVCRALADQSDKLDNTSFDPQVTALNKAIVGINAVINKANGRLLTRGAPDCSKKQG
ncbi:MAG: hypothetical protein EBQ96_08815 [Proteobacteria bacterium]|nr:hypothetical protein [Pseudomonadota bacterium]